MIQIPMQVATSAVSFPMAVAASSVVIPCVLDAKYIMGQNAIYDGAYEFTPADEPQTIQIADMVARENITINPIPSNYGKIGWNGNIITVS